MPQTRREFVAETIKLGSLVISAEALIGLLSGCETSTDPPLGGSGAGIATINTSVSGGTIKLTIDSNSPLNSVGSAALVQASSLKILVAHTADTTFKAVTAVCTHQGCTVTGFSGSTYTCPCHGSQFNTSGSVTRGPAGSSLSSFATSFSGGELTITV
jgi:cytochrome b6-f complex iron-sulfur subunit